jgi:hypothetical protein
MVKRSLIEWKMASGCHWDLKQMCGCGVREFFVLIWMIRVLSENCTVVHTYRGTTTDLVVQRRLAFYSATQFHGLSVAGSGFEAGPFTIRSGIKSIPARAACA